MGSWRRWLSSTSALFLAASLLTPVAAQAEENVQEQTRTQVVAQNVLATGAVAQVTQDDLKAQLEAKTEVIWGYTKNIISPRYDQVIALWHAGEVDPKLLKKKASPKVPYDTTVMYTKAVLETAAIQANPYAYNGQDFAGKLFGSQIGTGYFAVNGGRYDGDSNTFIDALFAAEYVGAEYNQGSAVSYLESIKAKVKSYLNGRDIGLAVSALASIESEKAKKLSIEFLEYFRDNKNYTAAGLGLYVDNLYAIGEDPLDERWHLSGANGEKMSVLDAYQLLIHPKNEFAFYESLSAAQSDGNVESNSSWSLVGLKALVEGESIVQKAKKEYASISFDFVPDTIEVTNASSRLLVKDTTFKPEMVVKNSSLTAGNADVTIQSSNPDIISVNEKNELVPLKAGSAVITFVVDGYDDVKLVLPFKVVEDAAINEILPKIDSAVMYLKTQTKRASFEDTLALKVFGYDPASLAKTLNIYDDMVGLSNVARNILSISIAELDLYTYNDKDYVKALETAIQSTKKIDGKTASYAILAQYALGIQPSDKLIDALLNDLYDGTNGEAYYGGEVGATVYDTSIGLQTIALIRQQHLTQYKANELQSAEKKLALYFQQKYEQYENKGKISSEPEKHAMGILNYNAFSGEYLFEIKPLEMAAIILKRQYGSDKTYPGAFEHILNSKEETTGLALNTLSTLITGQNAYEQLNSKAESKPTTIYLTVSDKAKLNETITLTGELLDQDANTLDEKINWYVNGEQVNETYTPDKPGTYTLRAEVDGVFAEKAIEVVDYEKVYHFTINPIEEAVTDKDIRLTATVTDSEGIDVIDPNIKWSVEGDHDVLLNESAVRFTKPGNYTVMAEIDGEKAKALEIEVTVNVDSIQAQVEVAVEEMKAYLEQKGQYDYISALAYSKVVDDAEASREAMRAIGHLREYGKHDEKYALYYAKNIFQAVAASEDPTQFVTSKGPIVDLVTSLVNSQDEDGHFTMFQNFDKTSVLTQIYAIMALDLIGQPYDDKAAIQDLLNGLNGDLTEGTYTEQELRALSLIALSKHRDKDGVEDSINFTLKYLSAQQNDNAGFDFGGDTNSPFAIGTVIQGLIAVGENPYDVKWKKNGRTMVEALLAQQIDNGGFKFGDSFDPDIEFDEYKATESAFGALADLYRKQSMFNDAGKIIETLPQVTANVKPFIEVEEVVVAEEMPLVSMTVNAFDNIDGELSPTVTVNDKPVYAVDNTYKAVVEPGKNEVKISTTNSQGNTTTQTRTIVYSQSATQSVPQVDIMIQGLNGEKLYTNKAIIEDGDTAYSVLVKAIGKSNVKAKMQGTSVYVESINNLGEFDHGEGSGWMYRVNGVFPKVFSGEVTLKDGDKMDWLYTEDYGADIGFLMQGGSNTPEASNPEQTVTEEKPKEDAKTEDSKTESTPTTGGSTSGGGSASGGGSVSGDTTTPVEENPAVQQPTEKPAEEPATQQPTEKPTEESATQQPTEKPAVPQPTDVVQLEREEELQKATIDTAKEIVHVQSTEGITMAIPVAALPQKAVDVALDVQKQGLAVQFKAEAQDVVLPKHAEITIPASVLAPTDGAVLLRKLPNGSLVATPFTVENGQFVLKTKTSGEFVVSTENKTFKDIQKDGHKQYIEELAKRHIITGKTEEIFDPKADLTRGQFSAMLVRALDLQKTGEQAFDDAKNHYFANELQALVEFGVLQGDGPALKPGASITRVQAALMLERLLTGLGVELPDVSNATLKFTDSDKISESSKASILLMQELEIFTGKKDGSFDPNAKLTRSQMSKVIYKTLSYAKMM